jgi:hypothetical protein
LDAFQHPISKDWGRWGGEPFLNFHGNCPMG